MIRRLLVALNAYSGLLQAIAAFLVAWLTVSLIRWNKKYVQITERLMTVAQSQLEVSVQQTRTALQQTEILKEQWDHAREPRIVLRVLPWRDPVVLEIVNVGEPIVVIRRLVVWIPVAPRSSSPIEILLSPTVVLNRSAFYEVSLDTGIRQFLSARNIPADTFKSLAKVTVGFQSWDRTFGEGMWIFVEMRNGQLSIAHGSVPFAEGQNMDAFKLYQQQRVDDMNEPVPLPLWPGTH